MDHKDYRLAAIMFTDIVGFSRMMEKDEAGTLKLMDFHNELVKKQVDEFNGKIIKTIGDAFLVEFPTANNAVKCAVEIQKDLESHNKTQVKSPLILRIGVHLGDIHFSDNDALGEGINIASRLQSLCRPGRVCISGEVHNLVSNKIDIAIQPLGAVTLKNISRALTAFEIMTNGAAEEVPAAVPVVSQEERPLVTNSATVPPAFGSNMDEEEESKRLRAIIFQIIKQEGRRLSVAEMRLRLEPKDRGAFTDSYLEKLADGGFLIRSSPRKPDTGPETSTDYAEDDWRSKYSRRMERWESRLERMQERYGPSAGPRHQPHIPPHMVGHEIARQIKSEVMNAVSENISAARGRKPVTFDQYMEKLDRQVKQERDGFRGHLRSYVAVNVGMWVIWGATSLLGFPWPLIVNLAWGIGIASHWAAFRDKRREASQLKSLPSLNQKQFGLVRKLFRERRGWTGHLVSNLAVAGFLAVLNIITSMAFPWAVFPIAGMAIGLFAHLPAFKSKEQDLLAQLSSEGVPIDVLSSGAVIKEIGTIQSTGAVGPVAAEADRIRVRILRQVKGLKGANPLGDDFETVLENYIRQIKELTVRDRDIDNIISTIPVRDLDKELQSTQAELDQATEPRMRAEYEKAVEQIGKQKKAYGEMVSEQKVLKLRLNNALNSLKQLEIDLARMNSLSSGKDIAASAPAIKEKSNELNDYLNDLRSGYQEIDALEKGFFGLEAELAAGTLGKQAEKPISEPDTEDESSSR